MDEDPPQEFANHLDADDNEHYPGEAADDAIADPEVLPPTGGIKLLPCHAQTRKCREYHKNAGGSVTRDACLYVLESMKQVKLDLTSFVYYATGREVEECVQNPRLQYQRTAWLHSQELDHLLRGPWYKAPRAHDAGIKTVGARNTLNEVAQDIMTRRINQELREVAPFFLAAEEHLEESKIIFDIQKLVDDVQQAAPTLWSLLASMYSTPLQQERNTMKDPTLVVHLASVLPF